MLPKRLNLLIWPVGKEVCEQTGSDNNITYIKKEIYLVAGQGVEPCIWRLWASNDSELNVSTALSVSLPRKFLSKRTLLVAEPGFEPGFSGLWDQAGTSPVHSAILSSKWDSNPQPSPWQGDYLTNWYITASGAGPVMQQGIIPHIFQIYYTSDVLTVQTS